MQNMDRQLTKFDWPKKAVLQLIALWQAHECLYNPKHKFYHNKRERYSALKEISDTFKELNFDIGVNEIKNKMTYLRGQYTREIAKAKERNGAGTEDAYVPSAYWFNELTFLEDFIKIRKVGCNPCNQSQMSVESDASYESVECEVPPRTKKKLRLSRDEQPCLKDSVLAAATAVLQNIATSTERGEYKLDDSYCTFIKNEISQISSPIIKDELKEKITLLVFEAKKKERMLNMEHAFKQEI